MTSTPRTDAAIIAADGRWTYELKEEMQAMERELAAAMERIRQLEKQTLEDSMELGKLDAASERLDSLRKAVAKQNEEISQACGKALGYPWFKDDQKNFPGATEDCGVCVGEHVAVTIVEELAREYGKSKERIRRLEVAGDALAKAADEYGIPYHGHLPSIWREAKESKP